MKNIKKISLLLLTSLLIQSAGSVLAMERENSSNSAVQYGTPVTADQVLQAVPVPQHPITVTISVEMIRDTVSESVFHRRITRTRQSTENPHPTIIGGSFYVKPAGWLTLAGLALGSFKAYEYFTK
jgi:hypothetical protein